MGRFINADAFTSTGQGLLGNNMFAYCGNNPVNYEDPSGCFAGTAVFPVCWGGVDSPLKLGPYNSEDEAAQAFAEYVYSKSQYIRYEYGTEIYKITKSGSIFFYFNYPSTGEPHSVRVGYPVPDGAIMVAYAHTHPNSDGFSITDINIAKEYRWDAYVVGPGKILKKYCVASNSYLEIGTISSRELTLLDKQILVSLFSDSWNHHILEGCKFHCDEKVWPSF